MSTLHIYSKIVKKNLYTHHIKELDRGSKVRIFLVVLDYGWSQDMTCTLYINPRLIHRRQLYPLQISHSPEQNLWTNPFITGLINNQQHLHCSLFKISSTDYFAVRLGFSPLNSTINKNCIRSYLNPVFTENRSDPFRNWHDWPSISVSCWEF